MTDNKHTRRVRIVNDGGPAYSTKVTDADTGEFIDGVAKIEISIEVTKEPIKAKITYYTVNEHGNTIKGEDCNPVKNVAVLDNPCIDITALG